MGACYQQHSQEANPSMGQKGGSAGVEGTTAFRGRCKAENSAARVGGNVSAKWLSLLATENEQR